MHRSHRLARLAPLLGKCIALMLHSRAARTAPRERLHEPTAGSAAALQRRGQQSASMRARASSLEAAAPAAEAIAPMKQRLVSIGLSFLLQRSPGQEFIAGFRPSTKGDALCNCLFVAGPCWERARLRPAARRSVLPVAPIRSLAMTVPTRPRPASERRQLPTLRARPLPSEGSQAFEGETLVIGLFSADLSRGAAAGSASSASGGTGATIYELSERANRLLGPDLARIVKKLVEDAEPRLKSGSSVTTHLLVLGDSNTSSVRVRRVAVYCLGKEDDFNTDILNKFGAFVSTQLKSDSSQPDRLGVVIASPQGKASLAPEVLTQRLAEAVLLAAFTDDRFRSSEEEDGATKGAATKPSGAFIDLLGADETAVKRGEAMASGVILTREIVNAPPNVATPEFFAETARSLAESSRGSITCTILEKEDCERLGMGAFLGVAQGSELPPKFIHMKYTSPVVTPGKTQKRVCLVGKGITHDTGGYNLKTAGSMIELMKFDCGGAAACFGTMKAIMALEPPNLELSVITACCENMISGKAYHPGDILTASNGKTIEVLNTDAEGRLTLADALLYAQQNIPNLDALVDIATLTGACIVALGTEYSGMWTAHDDIAARLDSAAKLVGERVWRMPLAPEYREGLKGKISDLKNITGGRWGGAIIAALFLQEFVKKEVPWAHLDIAGTVWNEKQSMATGVPTRTLVEFVEGIARG